MPQVDKPFRITIVQYAGDFREASERLRSGGAETYRGQRYTVDFVERLAIEGARVTNITGFTEQQHDTILPSGVRAIGAGFKDRLDGRALVPLVAESRPDLLVLRAPIRPVMLWAIRNRVRTLMLLADSFNGTSIKSRLSRRALGLVLTLPNFQTVANHGLRAAQQLVRAGVPASKTLAWDYPAFDTPHDWPAKHRSGDREQILFVGMLIKDKGVDDLIEAVALLKQEQRPTRLDLIGTGETERLSALAARLNVAERVNFIGKIPNDEVIARMAAADVITVPSRHIYSEGMPLTIYEAYCSRTPLVVTDHPMFVGNVIDGEAGLIVPEKAPDRLADAFRNLFDKPDLYASLSLNSPVSWDRLQLPVKWDEVITRSLANTPDDRVWFRAHSMAVAG